MKKILNFSIALIINFPAISQSMRNPTPTEKKILMRVIGPINQNLNFFLDNNWEMTQGIADADIDVPNSSKSQLGTAYLVTLKVKEGAPVYKQSMEKINRFVQEQKQDSIVAAYAEMKKQSEIKMDIDINDASVGLGTMPKKKSNSKYQAQARLLLW